MHFLFVSTYLGPTVGGLETLISRMSNWLLNRNHRVTLLANAVPERQELFPRGIKIIELGDQLLEICFWHKGRKTWPDLGIERPDVIKSFDLTAAWIASVISSGMKPVPKNLFGNYFPYLTVQSRNPLKSITPKLFLLSLRRNFVDESILCMSEEQVSEFRLHYGPQRNPIFWPLPIEDPSKNSPARIPRWGQIVSVGRLEPMKEYNIYMIDVIARLRQKGYPVTWTVFGEGTFEQAMKARIKALGLDGAIELKGRLVYSQFATAMQHAYLFVGMGTAIVEAALCGVPGVVALAHETSGVTYGCLHQFRFGNVGERMATTPATTIEAEIERILTLGKNEYEEEMHKTREYAKAYDMDSSMNRFMEITTKTPVSKTSSAALFYWYYVIKSIEQARQLFRVMRGGVGKPFSGDLRKD
jgi:glycosyltransferase involved in cell wall biosynthesis